jgi:hypothetical protein
MKKHKIAVLDDYQNVALDNSVPPRNADSFTGVIDMNRLQLRGLPGRFCPRGLKLLRALAERTPREDTEPIPKAASERTR